MLLILCNLTRALAKIEWFSNKNYQPNKTLRPINWLTRWLIYDNDDDLIRLCGDDPF